MHADERFNGYSHLLGLVLALAGAWPLLSLAAAAGDTAATAGIAVFLVCAVLLYAASTLFHTTRGALKQFWRRADHCAIYLLIAGSFTPFALAVPSGRWTWPLLALLWAAALVGMAMEIRADASVKPSALPYLAIGWACVLAAVPLAAQLDGQVLAWLLAGAAFYSAGTVFYRNRRGWRHAHGTWHMFVLCGTASHYAALVCCVR